MFLLLETLIAFAAIMLLLSYLVKALTSVVKNNIQYYGQNLQLEVRHLVGSLRGQAVTRLETVTDGKGSYPFRGIDWRYLSDEFLTKENLTAFLASAGLPIPADLEKRLKQHRKNLLLAFERRMKTLSFACGLVVCLLFNVNAFSIWNELYENGEVRAKFASGEFVDATLDKLDETKKAEGRLEDLGELPSQLEEIEAKLKAGGLAPEDRQQHEQELEEKKNELEELQKETGVDTPEKRREALAKLADAREHYDKELQSFLREVDFGVGRVWKQGWMDLTEEREADGVERDEKGSAGPAFYLFEFLASLLTGILVSVGAPYWHDLLRTLTAFRKKREVAVPLPGG